MHINMPIINGNSTLPNIQTPNSFYGYVPGQQSTSILLNSILISILISILNRILISIMISILISILVPELST